MSLPSDARDVRREEDALPPAVTIVVPTFNEAPNIAELVRRTTAAARAGGLKVEIVFVDDSTDDTPAVVRDVAATAEIPVRLIHRDEPAGGLGGAVVEGIRTASTDVCIVMDGDLQHPPEKILELVARYERGDADIVVASRYAGGGTSHGLAGRIRVLVSRLSTTVTRAMFPMRMRAITDPMTGFFLVDRSRVDFESLHPRGFKILLEILSRQQLRTAEIDFDFADRYAGQSKASFRQGIHFLLQLTYLRFGKMSLFAVIGGLGAVANIAIVWAMTQLGIGYLVSAIVAAEVTIIANFLLLERFVFREMRSEASGFWSRFAKSVSFNNAELLIRIPIVALMVESWHITAVVATAITLVVAFFARFLFHALVVYAPRRTGRSALRRFAEEVDDQAMSPGEL
ncbi:glycosyltransferase [Microbacterium sp.]|uniref:glycosyltransferase n=1 Tax=Microbacterium sp. TaxID=51671 RepID=UPI003F714346